MPRISRHSKERLVERNESIANFADAKRIAKIAWSKGNTINKYQIYPNFFNYLYNKKRRSHSYSIRIYRGNIYIWRGNRYNKTLVTSFPIPEKYQEEMELIDNESNSMDKQDGTSREGVAASNESIFST